MSDADVGGWSIQLDFMGGDPIRRLHKSVVMSLPPSNMILWSYHTAHLSLLKHTLQPASVRTLMTKGNAIDKLAIMCPVRTVGRPLMCTPHSWVEYTMRLLARATLRGVRVIPLFKMGVCSIMKIWVAPEFAMASFV